MQKNKNRQGYKKTKVGWIPNDWDCCRLRKVSAKITDGTHDTPTPVESGVPYITAIHVKDGAIDFKSALRLAQSDHAVIFNRCNPERGDVLMVNIGAGTASVAHVDVDFEFSMKNVALVKPDTSHLLGKFFELYQLSVKERLFHSLTAGGAQPFLSLKELGRLLIPLPSLPEQEAIAEVLECWDKAIRGYERKIEKKRNIKKGLMQRLLSGKQRLPGFDGEWKEVRLGRIAAINKGQQLNRVDQTEAGNYPVLNGGVQPLGYTDEWNTEANTITISEGGNSCGFVSFNRERFWCGGHCYALSEKATLVDKEFLYQSLKHRQLSIMRLRVGSGLPNIQKKTLEKFPLRQPVLEEQQAIASALSSADAEIAALENKLAALREQKRFLLNNMVTGTIRLPQFISRRAPDA